ncbi:regucalcin-like isoform X2 [Panulirus ornatus]
MQIYEDNDVTICIFILKRGVRLPLHDHPGMYGLLKVVHGCVSVQSYSLIGNPVDEGNQSGIFHATKHQLLKVGANDPACRLCPAFSLGMAADMASVKVEQLDIPCIRLGEGPHWLEDQQALLFVDVFDKALRRHFVHTGKHQILFLDDGGVAETASMVIPVEGEPDLLVVGLGKTLSVVRWTSTDPDRHTVKPKVIQTTTDDHFNDGKCDPQGRLWAGTMSPLDDKADILEYNNSSLFKYDHDLNFTSWVKKVTISNGLAWSHDRKTLYYIDSPALAVYYFDYDDAAGAISNQRVLLDYAAAGLKDQVPDGMTIDKDGNLWVACFGGGQVICVDPKAGQVIRKVAVPSKSITSVCWGGKDYSTLYVTSGTHKLTPEEIAANPSAGGTFAITGLGTKGNPPVNFRPNLEKLKAKLAA